jgi:hypothetical protein
MSYLPLFFSKQAFHSIGQKTFSYLFLVTISSDGLRPKMNNHIPNSCFNKKGTQLIILTRSDQDFVLGMTMVVIKKLIFLTWLKIAND